MKPSHILWTAKLAYEDEISSCLYSYLSNNLQEPVDTLKRWSETFGGQNIVFIFVSFSHSFLSAVDINSVVNRYPLSNFTK